MNDNTEIQKDDEISLLDLFAVLLRYRKLIIGITLAFIIPTAAGYFVYPSYKYNKSMKTNVKQGIMQIEIVQKAQPYVSQGLEFFIQNPEVITESLYVSGLDEFKFKGGKISVEDENKTTVMYLINLFWLQNLDLNGNTFIQRGKEHNMIFRARRIGGNTGSINEITFKNKDSVIIEKFLESIFEICTINVEENLRRNAQLMVSNYERIMNLSMISESAKLMLENNYDTYVFLKDFLDGNEIVLRRVSGPILTENFLSLSTYKSQYRKTGIIIVLAGFVLAVISAFALNAIYNIKNDEESMKKIRGALENSGGK
jgi:hypothetical protein